jgi:hypothetical protein
LCSEQHIAQSDELQRRLIARTGMLFVQAQHWKVDEEGNTGKLKRHRLQSTDALFRLLRVRPMPPGMFRVNIP